MICHKCHAIIYLHQDLQLFVLITPIYLHNCIIGRFNLLVIILLFRLQVLGIFTDIGFFISRMFWVIHDFLGTHLITQYDIRDDDKQIGDVVCFSGEIAFYYGS